MKRFLILFAVLFISILSYAQNSEDVKQIKKQRGSIVDIETNEVLSDSVLKQIFDEDTYNAYLRGKNKRIVSIPFWASTAACAVCSVSCYIISNNLVDYCYANHHHDHEFYQGAFCDNGALAYWLIGGLFAAGTVIYAVPSTILTISSCKDINSAVDSYNKKSTDMTLDFGATNNGIGLTLKF